MCIGIHVNYVKFERHAWPYPPSINCLLIYKCLIHHIGLMMQSFLSLEILFLTLTTPALLCITFGCNFMDIINVSAPIESAFNNVSARPSAPLLNASARRRANERSRHKLIAVSPFTSNMATVQTITDWPNTWRHHYLPVFIAMFLIIILINLML